MWLTEQFSESLLLTVAWSPNTATDYDINILQIPSNI